EAFEAIASGHGVHLLAAGNADIYTRPGITSRLVRDLSPANSPSPGVPATSAHRWPLSSPHAYRPLPEWDRTGPCTALRRGCGPSLLVGVAPRYDAEAEQAFRRVHNRLPGWPYGPAEVTAGLVRGHRRRYADVAQGEPDGPVEP